MLPSPEIVEIVGLAGYDYAWMDAEHGPLSLSELRQLIRAADATGVDSIVRVPSHDLSFIQQVLDLGAAGVMVPHLRTAEEGRRIAQSVRFSPKGTRGACPSVRAMGHVSFDWAADSRRADDDILVFGLIEDVEGVENVEAIARSGLDGLVFGPVDLGVALGYGADVGHPELRKLHDRVVEACVSAGIEYVAASIEWEFGKLDHSVGTVTGDRILLPLLRSALDEARMTGTWSFDIAPARV